MTQGRYGGPDGHDPFGYVPASGDPFAPAGGLGHPVSPPPPHETNTLATLSVIFAVVFAPAGAVLGHLGLAQIARTGQAGRDRALVGVTLSYVVIVTVVVAVAVRIAIGADPVHETPVAGPPSTTTTPMVTTSPPRPAPPPSPPPVTTVAADGMAGILVPLDQMKTIVADPNLVMGEEFDDVDLPPPSEAVFEPVECVGSMLAGVEPAYRGTDHRKFFANVPQDAGTELQVVQGVAIFDDATAAQRALATFVGQWQRCAGPTLNWHRGPRSAPITLGAPQDAGSGVTTLRNVSSPDGDPYFRAVAAKGNVVVDVQVSGGDQIPDQAALVAKAILARIPG